MPSAIAYCGTAFVLGPLRRTRSTVPEVVGFHVTEKALPAGTTSSKLGVYIGLPSGEPTGWVYALTTGETTARPAAQSVNSEKSLVIFVLVRQNMYQQKLFERDE
jgi:hypothetical protein